MVLFGRRCINGTSCHVRAIVAIFLASPAAPQQRRLGSFKKDDSLFFRSLFHNYNFGICHESNRTNVGSVATPPHDDVHHNEIS